MLMTNGAQTVSHGRGISYEVKLEAGDVVSGKLDTTSFFIDSVVGDACEWPGGRCRKRGW